MAFWNRSDTLSTAVADWQDRGLITPDLAERLQSDITQNRRGFSFANILVLLAIILIGFAAITFVAANWEDMPRLGRLSLLMIAVWGFWIAAIILRQKGHGWFAETCVLGACCTFGAAIMLVSQMYHIQGSPAGAVSYWAFGTLIAAGFSRSVPALCLAIILWGLWPWMDLELFRNTFSARPMFAVWMAVCVGLALWMQSRMSAHLIALATLGWIGLNTIQMMERNDHAAFLVVLMICFPVTSILLWSNAKGRFLRGFERAGIFYAFFLLSPMLLIWHMAMRHETTHNIADTVLPYVLIAAIIGICIGLAVGSLLRRHDNTYDVCVAAVAALITALICLFLPGALFIAEALMLGLSIWALRMGWRLDYRPIVVLGFIGFGALLLIIYFETIGTLLGTAAFYLVAGVTLLTGVILVPRLTRRKAAS